MTRSRPFTWIAAVIFGLMAIVHILRLFTHFRVVFGSHEIPMWVSYVAIVVAAFLSWMLCREARGAAPNEP
jgi:MFS superfamily sulfate permease-like transporter